jgi:cell division septation protein DedD
MAERQDKDVRELRLEGAGLFLIVAFLGAGLIGAFFLGRWYERSSAPPAGLDRLASDPLENVVPPEKIEDVDATANNFDTVDGSTVAEPDRQVTPPPAVETEKKPVKQADPTQAQPTTSPSATGGPFFVQIAAFRDRASADRVTGELSAGGYAAKIFSEDGPSGSLFKVRVGGYASREEAATIAGELKTKGHPGAFPTRIE